MPALTLNWSKEEFLTYFLLYAAHADVQFKDEEKQYILSKVDEEVYDQVYAQFKLDNNYEQLQKILNVQDNKQYYTKQQLGLAMQDIFLIDSHFHYMEKMVYSRMSRLFN